MVPQVQGQGFQSSPPPRPHQKTPDHPLNSKSKPQPSTSTDLQISKLPHNPLFVDSIVDPFNVQ